MKGPDKDCKVASVKEVLKLQKEVKKTHKGVNVLQTK